MLYTIRVRAFLVRLSSVHTYTLVRAFNSTPEAPQDTSRFILESSKSAY